MSVFAAIALGLAAAGWAVALGVGLIGRREALRPAKGAVSALAGILRSGNRSRAERLLEASASERGWDTLRTLYAARADAGGLARCAAGLVEACEGHDARASRRRLAVVAVHALALGASPVLYGLAGADATTVAWATLSLFVSAMVGHGVAILQLDAIDERRQAVLELRDLLTR